MINICFGSLIPKYKRQPLYCRYNPLVRIKIGSTSHITHVVCVDFSHEWRICESFIRDFILLSQLLPEDYVWTTSKLQQCK